MDKEKFITHVKKKLSIDQKELFGVMEVEQQKDIIVFRIPAGLVELSSVWEIIEQVAQELDVKVKQAGQYATLEELDDLLGDIQWLWKGWIPKGFVTMVAGDPGIGKSAVVQWLVKLITDGGRLPLEEFPLVDEGTAVWIDTEASQQIIKSRANSMEMNKKRVFIPVIMGDIFSQADLGIDKHRDVIINLVEGVKPDILVLDSLGGSHAKGENRVEDIRPVLEFLALLARDYQMAIIVIHHLNKGQDKESPEVSLYRLRGSTIIPAMCRSIFSIEKSYDGNNKMRPIKNNLSKAPEPITVIAKMDTAGDIVGFEFKPYQAPAAKKSRKELCADWVFEQVEKSRTGMSPGRLAELAEGQYTRQMIYAAKDLLGDRITVAGTGNSATWMVTQKDDAAISRILSSNGKHPKPIKPSTKPSKKSGDKKDGHQKVTGTRRAPRTTVHTS